MALMLGQYLERCLIWSKVGRATSPHRTVKAVRVGACLSSQSSVLSRRGVRCVFSVNHELYLAFCSEALIISCIITPSPSRSPALGTRTSEIHVCRRCYPLPWFPHVLPLFRPLCRWALSLFCRFRPCRLFSTPPPSSESKSPSFGRMGVALPR